MIIPFVLFLPPGSVWDNHFKPTGARPTQEGTTDMNTTTTTETTARDFITEGALVYVRDAGGMGRRSRVVKVGVHGAVVAREGKTALPVSFDRIIGPALDAGAVPFSRGCCTICGHAPVAPYRALNAAGEIIEGCVSPAHTVDDLSPADRRWHDRDASQGIRDGIRARGERFFTVR